MAALMAMSLTIRKFLGAYCLLAVLLKATAGADERPNILFCISDDQSFAHTGANGDPVVSTPAFDRIAREGIRFTHAFCDAPTCGPSRSAILTGQPIWRLEEAGNIHSTLPKKFATYTEILEKAGYMVGHTGKGWSPGKLEPGGRFVNPAGRAFNRHKYGEGALRDTATKSGMSNRAYAENFEDFLGERPPNKPFCFWLGTHEPHRGFEKGSGLAADKDPSDVIVPAFLPDHAVVREDILDYYMEVEHFDAEVGRAITALEQTGELDNTIVVVTSDHGMPFPRAKASLYDAGTRVPLAVRWAGRIDSPGRAFDGFVNLSDLAPTFLEAAGTEPPEMMIAQSLMPIFESKTTAGKSSAFIAMERHDGCRKGGKGYPCRAIRTAGFLYIKNHEPDRWPSGNPDRRFCARDIPFGEVDSSPTKQFLLENALTEKYRPFHELAFARRPAEELYDLATDPAQLRNVAGDADYASIKNLLTSRLDKHLNETKDPRALGEDAPWDYYPYYGVRKNKAWQVDPKP